MSYIVRNTIVLASALFLIFAIGGYLTFLSYPKKIKNIEKEIKRIEKDLQNTPDLANRFNTLNEQLATARTQWDTRTKEVPPKDITGETYGYLNQLIGLSGDLTMNMTYQPSADTGKTGYNRYSLSGSAYFENLYKFIWYIENGRRLFKIPGITLTGYEFKDSLGNHLTVSFAMDVWAYFSSVRELNEAPGQIDVVSPSPEANPFLPLIWKDYPSIRTGEIDIGRSVLRAVIPGKAFILDQSKLPRTIEEGDPVWLGSVTKILPAEGKVECILNKGGVPEHFELTMQGGQPVVQ